MTNTYGNAQEYLALLKKWEGKRIKHVDAKEVRTCGLRQRRRKSCKRWTDTDRCPQRTRVKKLGEEESRKKTRDLLRAKRLGMSEEERALTLEEEALVRMRSRASDANRL